MSALNGTAGRQADASRRRPNPACRAGSGLAVPPRLMGPAHVMTSNRVGTCLTFHYLVCENGERRTNLFYGDDATGAMIADADLSLCPFPRWEATTCDRERCLTTHRLLARRVAPTGRTSVANDVLSSNETAMVGTISWVPSRPDSMSRRVGNLRRHSSTMTLDDPLRSSPTFLPETEEHQLSDRPRAPADDRRPARGSRSIRDRRHPTPASRALRESLDCPIDEECS
jgi:hypothetical protein